MRKTHNRQPAADTYFRLVRRFPLRAIKSDAEHSAAREFLVATSLRHQRDNDSGVFEYIEALATLIENFEKGRKYGPDLSGLSPVSAINHLIDVHQLSVTRMAQLMGTSQGTLSEIRHGRRGVSKEMIRRLVNEFGVDARVFI